MTLKDTFNATSSLASRAGPTHSSLQDGRQTDLFGPDHVPASPSAPPATKKDTQMTAISGPISVGLSESANLTQCLANKLRRRLADVGSPEFKLTWKHWDIESGLRIYALRASARRIFDSGFFGLGGGGPTPTADTAERSKRYKQGGLPLSAAAQTAGWPTPRTPTGEAESAARKQELGRTRSGGGDLQAAAQTAGWPTPNAEEARRGFQNRANGKKGVQKSLTTVVVEAVDGPTESGYLAPTEKRGVLNPALSRWLMGYPVEWDSCGATAMQSLPSKRKRS